MKIGDLVRYSESEPRGRKLNIVIEVMFDHVRVAGLGDHGVRTYSMDVINSFAKVAK
jgi:hypothetical protein